MSSYSVDGSVLVVELVGESTTKFLRRFFQTVRADPKVPDGALLLFDSRKAVANYGEAEARNRLKLLVESLGPKLGAACAIVISENVETAARSFQKVTAELNLRTGLFEDLDSARQWLRVYDAESGDRSGGLFG